MCQRVTPPPCTLHTSSDHSGGEVDNQIGLFVPVIRRSERDRGGPGSGERGEGKEERRREPTRYGTDRPNGKTAATTIKMGLPSSLFFVWHIGGEIPLLD